MGGRRVVGILRPVAVAVAARVQADLPGISGPVRGPCSPTSGRSAQSRCSRMTGGRVLRPPVQVAKLQFTGVEPAFHRRQFVGKLDSGLARRLVECCHGQNVYRNRADSRTIAAIDFGAGGSAACRAEGVISLRRGRPRQGHSFRDRCDLDTETVEEKRWEYDAVEVGQKGTPFTVEVTQDLVSKYAQRVRNPKPGLPGAGRSTPRHAHDDHRSRPVAPVRRGRGERVRGAGTRAGKSSPDAVRQVRGAVGTAPCAQATP